MSSEKRKSNTAHSEQSDTTDYTATTDETISSSSSKRSKHSSTQEDTTNSDQLFDQVFIIIFTVIMLYAISVTSISALVFQEGHMSEVRSNQALLRKPKERKNWSVEEQRFTDRMFYRLFRMS